MRKYLISSIIFFSACSITTTELPGQNVVEVAVWNDVYEMSKSQSPPKVYWVEADYWGTDIEGTTLAANGVLIACGYHCDWPITYTAYAHELLHWRHWVRTGDVDIEHKHEDWAHLVPKAEAAMEAAIDAAGLEQPHLL